MAGPQTIQRLPRGLLDALQMKGTGDLPHLLGAELVANYDATELYLADRLTSQSSNIKNFTSGATNNNLNIVVPQGEIWLVFAVGGLFQTGVGASITNGQVLLARSNPTISGYPIHTDRLTLAASFTTWYGGQLNRIAIMLPQDQLQLACSAAVASATASITIEYYRLTF
jgi:hypothetical protein